MARTVNTEKTESVSTKEQCFVITPIGDDNSDIRRHIEGIIDAVIRPALEDQYEIVVAHRISTPGSITKQIIEAIYNAKLVIANLTNCNPNVMYELALRHGIGKPVIMIAAVGTKLPSDIMMQRTIFYRNDALGVLELRDKLKNTADKIDFQKKSGLVFEALGEISHDAAMLKKVAEKDTNSQEPLEYIMRRLDRIERSISSQSALPASSTKSLMYKFFFDSLADVGDFEPVYTALKARLAAYDCTMKAWDVGDNTLWIGVEAPNAYPRRDLGKMLDKMLSDMNIECRSWRVEDA